MRNIRPCRKARSSTASARSSWCWSFSGWRCIRRRSSSPCSSTCSSDCRSPPPSDLWMVGSLNLLSIAFAVLFVGLGVDFGIQFSVRYRSERFKNDDLVEALEEAARRSAVPLSLAAMATAAGFLCFLPTDYKGISELGEIAGAGMADCVSLQHHGAAGAAEADQPARRERAGRLRLPRAGRSLPRGSSRRRSSAARSRSRSPACRCSIS